MENDNTKLRRRLAAEQDAAKRAAHAMRDDNLELMAQMNEIRVAKVELERKVVRLTAELSYTAQTGGGGSTVGAETAATERKSALSQGVPKRFGRPKTSQPPAPSRMPTVLGGGGGPPGRKKAPGPAHASGKVGKPNAALLSQRLREIDDKQCRQRLVELEAEAHELRFEHGKTQRALRALAEGIGTGGPVADMLAQTMGGLGLQQALGAGGGGGGGLARSESLPVL